jgi:His/Glu/Gln/Arg/opine family amino acid ABC transporter permease subunit
MNGIPMTVLVTTFSLAVGLVAGLFIALARLSGIRLLKFIATAYTEFFRNTPALVLLFWVYFALPSLNITLPVLAAVALSLGLNASGYMAEIYRTGFQSVKKGQAVAGRSLGLSEFQIFRKIIFPQALRIMMPLMVNQTAILFKWSSLVAVIGVEELTHRARWLSSMTFRPVEIYTSIAIFYLVVSSSIAFLAGKLEKRWAAMY